MQEKTRIKIINFQGSLYKFNSSKELNENIASMLINDFQEPGLVMLAAGRTFEADIYSIVNNHFAMRINDSQADSTRKAHPGLKLTQLDEIITKDSSKLFSNSISKQLSELKDHFYPLDLEHYQEFDRFIKTDGGPKAIYMGLGQNPAYAHVAFIGEDFINRTTSVVKLSPELEARIQVEYGISIGVDIFESSRLEHIHVVVKGSSKAESLLAAFEDPDTGLGYLIEHFAAKLKIYCDHEAAALIKEI